MATRVLLLCLSLFLQLGRSLHIRSATAKDVFTARKILFQEAMNPLAVSERTLVVAEDQFDDSSSSNSGSSSSSGTTALLGFGQIRPLDAEYSELASLYVMPDHREKGIGSAIVEYLLKQHDANPNHPKAICLLTLEPTMHFYAKHGFVQAPPDDLPPALKFEFKAGAVVSSLLGNDIVCMIRNVPSRENI